MTRKVMWASLLLLVVSAHADDEDAEELSFYRGLFVSLLLLNVVFFVVYWYIELEPIFPSESAVAMGLGIAMGGLAKWWGVYTEAFQFNDNVFSALILPIIMLNFGYNSRSRFFVLNSKPVVLWSVWSLLICFHVFAVSWYFVSELASQPDWPTYTAGELVVIVLFMATVVQAVEPGSMLSHLSEKYQLETQTGRPVLHPLLLGESIFSMAQMYDSASILIHMPDTGGWKTLGDWAWRVVVSTLLGGLVGVAFGVGACLVTKYCDMRRGEYQYHELGFLLIFPFLCYWGCQYSWFAQREVRISPPIAICVAGSWMGNYAWKNMSQAARLYYGVVVGSLARVAELYNYMILGSTLHYVIDNGQWIWSYFFVVLGLMYGARLCTIPCVAVLRGLFGTPTAYGPCYPAYARRALTEEEREDLGRVFVSYDADSDKSLDAEELRAIFSDFGHEFTPTQIVGLMRLVTHRTHINTINLFEFYELCERTGYHRPGTPPSVGPPGVVPPPPCPTTALSSEHFRSDRSFLGPN